MKASLETEPNRKTCVNTLSLPVAYDRIPKFSLLCPIFGRGEDNFGVNSHKIRPVNSNYRCTPLGG
jgi:hypothetical protein